MKAEIPWTLVIFIAIVTVRGSSLPDCLENEDVIVDLPANYSIVPDPTIKFDNGLISGHLHLM